LLNFICKQTSNCRSRYSATSETVVCAE